MPYDDDKRVIFLHVPKTGGTTVKRLFEIRQLDDPDPTIRPSPQHLTCDLLRGSIGEDKYWSYYNFLLSGILGPGWSAVIFGVSNCPR